MNREFTAQQHDSMTTSSAEAAEAAEVGCVDIGWILVDQLDDLDKQAIKAARDAAQERLANAFPEFEWRLRIEIHEGLEAQFQREPVEYLDWAVAQRDVRGWDFVLVFVAADLQTIWQAHAWAAVSRSLDSVVISTARIDPRSQDTKASEQERAIAISRRVQSLVMQSLGHLNGLDQAADPPNYMHAADSLVELDSLTEFSEPQQKTIRENLRRIADLRLEEESPPVRWSRWLFYLRAGWRNRYQILSGIRHARPWQLPLRLAGLSMAALSTLVVLLMTAEAWDLAASQSIVHVLLLSAASITATTIYVTVRQRLLVRRGRSRLTEQIVTTQLTTLAIVAAGIVTTYAGLFVLASLLSFAFFRTRLIAAWTTASSGNPGFEQYLLFAAFASAIGIAIGAMGASFEGQHYFRHVTLIDEEI
ncbi:MAG: hypothetical protein RIC55_12405 [Pirellulaceae bacterium]